MKEKLSKLKNVYKKYGLFGFLRKLYAYFVANYLNKISVSVLLRPSFFKGQVADILNSESFDRVILWRSSFGYQVPLFQRPQHIAANLSKKSCLVFYEVTTMTDQVKTIKKLSENFYLVNFNNVLFNKILMKELERVEKPKFVQLYSTDWKLSVSDIQSYMNKGYGFIYEYIDDISPELAGTKEIPCNILEKYRFAMSEQDVFIVTTANRLFEDVVRQRGKQNLVLSSNGVDVSFFKDIENPAFVFEKEFNAILDRKKPIVCYYGALATWFDYDLVKKIAASGKYSVVLFGIKYDESFDKNLSSEDNIYFLGQRDYKILKYYAAKCDILAIPFKINDITRATSPVKLFEYMALNKPIVTTDMDECRKYKSVLIGKDHNDFIEKLSLALEKGKEEKYQELLLKEAKENDWSIKAQQVIDLIKE